MNYSSKMEKKLSNFSKSEVSEKSESFANTSSELSFSTSPEITKKKQLSSKLLENNNSRNPFSITLNSLAGSGNDINRRSSNKKQENYGEIKFSSLSGYPLIQYNLSLVLLYKLSPQDVIITFFYSFLEKDILFFSSNIEYLSFTINSYLNLNFPLNDETYYFYNACVSYENFISDNSPFVGSTFTSILGINSSYNPEYLKSLSKTKLKDHLAVDLDKGVIYQVDDPNNKDQNVKNKLFFDFLKKMCKKDKKESKDDKDKGIIFIREVKILYEKLDSYYKMYNENETNYNEINKRSQNRFISYDENGQNSIKMINRNIQEGFYRLVNYLCLYFYQNLSLKSKEEKEIEINRKNKGNVEAETINVIFHKDYNNEEKNYTKEEVYLLDELVETTKFDSFVYGFIQFYDA